MEAEEQPRAGSLVLGRFGQPTDGVMVVLETKTSQSCSPEQARLMLETGCELIYVVLTNRGVQDVLDWEVRYVYEVAAT